MNIRFRKPASLVLLAAILAKPLSADMSMGAFELGRKIKDMKLRSRHAGRSAGVYLPLVDESELDLLKRQLLQFKAQVEVEPKDGRIEEYLGLYARMVDILALAAPHKAMALANELAPLVSAGTAWLDGIKSESLTKAEPVWVMQESHDGMVQVKVGRHYMEKIIKDKALLRERKTPDELLFAVAQKIILKRLELASKQTGKLIAQAEGRDGLEEHERESLFREFLLAQLEKGKTIEAQMAWLDLEWLAQKFLPHFFPGQEFSSNDERVSIFHKKMMGRIQGDIQKNIRRSPWPLATMDSVELGKLLCKTFKTSSLRIILSLKEAGDKDLKQRLSSLIEQSRKTCHVPPALSLEVKNQLQERTSEFSKLVASLERIKHLHSHPQELMAQPVNLEVVLKNYRIVQGEKSGHITWNKWLNEVTEFASFFGFSYQQFKEVVEAKKNEQIKLSSKSNAGGLLLQEMSKFAGKNLERIQDLEKYLRFDEQGRQHLNYADLGGLSSDQEEQLSEIWLLVKKNEYPILEVEVDGKKLFELLQGTSGQSAKYVLDALKKSLDESHKALERTNNWENIEDLKVVLKKSTVLNYQMRQDDMVRGFFLQKADQLDETSNLELSAKKFFHHYVGIGFMGLIAVDIFPHLFKFMGGPGLRVASYLREAGAAVPPKMRRAFIISAFSLIGVNLAYDAFDLFYRETPKVETSREFFASSVSKDTRIFDIYEYLQIEEEFSYKKSSFYVHAAIDGLFLSTLAVFAIPGFARHTMGLVQKTLDSRAVRLNKKVEKHFARLGMDGPHITWDRQVLEDVYRLQHKSLSGQMDKLRDKMLRFKGKEEEWETLAQSYKQLRKSQRELTASYKALVKKYRRFQKLWRRYGNEFRFDFERLGLTPGQWDWREIKEAYNVVKKKFEAAEISKSEFYAAQESHEKLVSFLFRKFYTMRNHPSLKKLFMEAAIYDREGTFFYDIASRPLNSRGEFLEYDIVTFESESGQKFELIMPKIYNPKLLQKLSGDR